MPGDDEVPDLPPYEPPPRPRHVRSTQASDAQPDAQAAAPEAPETPEPPAAESAAPARKKAPAAKQADTAAKKAAAPRKRAAARKPLPPRPSYSQGGTPETPPIEAAAAAAGATEAAKPPSSPVSPEAAWAGAHALPPPETPGAAGAPPAVTPPAAAVATGGSRERWWQRAGRWAARWHLPLEALGVFVVSLWLTRFFMPAMADGKQALYQDVLVNAAAPDRHGVGEMLRNGIWPSWVRYSYGGEAFIANGQHGVLYIGNLPFYFLHTSTALDLMVALHVAWAALGAWAYCRLALRTGLAAALFAALTFAFGSQTLQHTILGDQLQVIVWMPWVFLAAHLALERQRLRWTVLTAVMIGMQFLAGHPEEWVYTIGALALYAIAWIVGVPRDWARRLWKATLHLGGAVVLFVLLFGWQLLPTLLLKSQGYRTSPTFKAQFPLPTSIAVNSLLPDYHRVLFGENVAFIGVVGLGLFALGIVGLRRRDLLWLRVWLVVLAAFGFLMALGLSTGFYSFLYHHAPLVKGFRVPARYLLLTYFALVVGAALGMDELLTTAVGRWRPRLRQGLAAVGVLVVGAAYAFLLGSFTRTGHSYRLWLVAGVIGVVAWVLATIPKAPRAALALVLLLTTYQELRTARPFAEYRQKAPNVVYDSEGPTAPYVDGGGRYITIATDPVTGQQKQEIKVPAGLTGRERDYFYVGWYQRVQMRPNAHLAALAETVQSRDGGLLPLRRFRTFYLSATGSTGDINAGKDTTPPSKWKWPALDFLGVQRFVTDDNLPASEQAVLRAHGFRNIAHPDYVYVWERPAPSLVRLVHDVQVVPGEQAQAKLLSGGFDLQRRAIVEKPVALDPKPTTGTESARVTHVGSSTMAVRTTSTAKSLLVLADPYYPGWKVTVDGKDAKILPVDTAFRGVVLPPGDHLVQFHYADPRFWGGVWLAGATVIGLLLWTAAARSARRRLSPPASRPEPTATSGAPPR